MVSTHSTEHSTSLGVSTGTPAGGGGRREPPEEGEPKSAPRAARGSLNVKVNTNASDRHREAEGRVCADGQSESWGCRCSRSKGDESYEWCRNHAHTTFCSHTLAVCEKSMQHTHNQREWLAVAWTSTARFRHASSATRKLHDVQEIAQVLAPYFYRVFREGTKVIITFLKSCFTMEVFSAVIFWCYRQSGAISKSTAACRKDCLLGEAGVTGLESTPTITAHLHGTSCKNSPSNLPAEAVGNEWACNKNWGEARNAEISHCLSSPPLDSKFKSSCS